LSFNLKLEIVYLVGRVQGVVDSSCFYLRYVSGVECTLNCRIEIMDMDLLHLTFLHVQICIKHDIIKHWTKGCPLPKLILHVSIHPNHASNSQILTLLLAWLKIHNLAKPICLTWEIRNEFLPIAKAKESAPLSF